MLILLVSVGLGWLPASGYEPLFSDPVRSLRTTIMPAFVLGSGLAAVLMRHTRSAMLGVLQADYVRTARAKGVSERKVILKHGWRNALLPVVTLTALLFGELLGGAVLTEQIFTIPGFGKLTVDAVFNRDYAVVQGVVLCTAAGFILMNLDRRHSLRAAQPAHEGYRYDRHIIADRPRRRHRRSGSRAWKKFKSGKGALVGLMLVGFFVVLAILAPILPIADPVGPGLGGGAQGALHGPLDGHRRSGTRRALAHHLRRPGFADGRRRSRWPSPWSSAYRSAWSRAISAAGSTRSSRA